jgi:hypothetical protein
MAESLYLLLLTAGLYFFVRWWLHGRWQDVTLAGVAFGLGVVSRYEVAAWLAIVVFGALAVDSARRRARVSIEASLLVLLVPTVYFLTLWTYLTGAITGSPLYWFTALAPKDRGLGAELDLGVVTEAVTVQAGLFPPTLLLAAIALAAAIRWRQPVAAVVAVALVVDLVATVVFVTRSGGDPNYFQLRYNLRAIPVAFVAVAVLLALVPQPRRRIAGVVAAVALVAAAPATALTMSRYGNALGEAAFVEGVFTGRGQDGVAPPRGTGNSVAKTRETARFLLDRADRPSSILTDDAHTYAVMLATGRPDLFLDRIDVGDDRWTDVAERPHGVVDFLLVNSNPLRADLLVALHPGLRSGSPPPFARLAFSNGAFAVYEVGR